MSEDYRKGFEDGLRCFAWWKDGVQHVGTTGKTLAMALEQMDELYGFNPPAPTVHDSDEIRNTTNELQSIVDRWNVHRPVGTPVDVMLDDGTVKRTTTRSEAWVMGGHTAVVSVEGISGGYMLSRVRPLT